jgi:hypothetical protein
MRATLGPTVALLLLATAQSAAEGSDGYGNRLCTRFMGASAPCSCVGPILEMEFDRNELEPLLAFMRAVMDQFTGTAEGTIKIADDLIARHGQATIENWIKRYNSLEPKMEKACMWKW